MTKEVKSVLKLPADIPENATVVVNRSSLRVVRVEPGKAFEDASHGGASSSLLAGESIHERLHLPGPPLARFTNAEQIGEGSSGYVFAVRDENCGREVAVKVLKDVSASDYPEEIQRFLTEGRTVAGLEHPSIIPVYDLDMDENGKVYLSMRRVNGCTLHEYIESMHCGMKDQNIRSNYELIQVVLKVCDALAFAHNKGHIHQDIKPDNIMVGEYGQVFVIDWGASSCSGDELSLTPVYMSPQQACAKLPTEQDDVYCLGATLFHCLVGRYPTDGETLEELVDKKRHGVIDELNEEEQSRVPKPLLAIVMKALEPSPRNRYHSIKTFADDLKNYQEGKAVHAYEYSMVEFLWRWLKRHRHGVLTTLLISSILLVSATVFYKMKLEEIATWGAPAVVEDFEDDSWKDDWIFLKGTGEVKGGRMVSTNPHSFQFLYRHKLMGSHAIEFEGEMQEDSPPGDLSVIWFKDIIFDPDGTVKEAIEPTLIQTGSYSNSYALIRRGGNRMDYSPFRNVPGKIHKVRVEVDGNMIRLFADDRKICEVEDVFHQGSGYFALYGYYPGKTFDNIRIYRKGLPKKAPVTIVGDSYFRDGAYAKAIEFFGEVERSHPDSAIGNEARYKRGLALHQLGQRKEALQLWEELEHTKWWPHARIHHCQDLLEERMYEEAVAIVADLARHQSGRKLTVQFWDQAIHAVRREGERYDLALKLIDIRKEYFPDESVHGIQICHVLAYLGRHEEIVGSFPELQWPAAQALLSLGRYEDVLECYPEQDDLCARALLHLGRYDEVLERYPMLRGRCVDALILKGQPEQVLNSFPEDMPLHAKALMAMGQYKSVLNLEANRIAHESKEAFMFLGRAEEALDVFSKSTGVTTDLHIFLDPRNTFPAVELEGSHSRGRVLLARGRFTELLETVPQEREKCALGLLAMGELDRVAREYPFMREATVERLYYQGNSQAALKRALGDGHMYATMLIRIGKSETVLERNFPSADSYGEALIWLKRYAEAARCYQNRLAVVLARNALAIEAMKAGETEQAAKHLDTYSTAQSGFWEEQLMLPQYVIRPLLYQKLGNTAKANEILDDIATNHHSAYGRRLWHMVAFIRGDIDQTQFLAQPYKLRADARLVLAQAIKSDLERKPEALEQYEKFATLDKYRKPLNPVVEQFVDWRIQELSQ